MLFYDEGKGRCMNINNMSKQGLFAEEQNGFTLNELVLVIVIMAILLAIAIPNYVSMEKNAKESSVKSAMLTMQFIAESFASASGGMYPCHTSDFCSYIPNGVLPTDPYCQATYNLYGGGSSCPNAEIPSGVNVCSHVDWSNLSNNPAGVNSIAWVEGNSTSNIVHSPPPHQACGANYLGPNVGSINYCSGPGASCAGLTQYAISGCSDVNSGTVAGDLIESDPNTFFVVHNNN